MTTYSWDYRNRLTDVEYYNNSNVLTKHVHYVYDVFNGLIGEEDDNTGNGSYDHVERYVVNALPNTPVAGQPTAGTAQPQLQFDGNGNLKERNLVALNPAAVDAVIAQEPVSSPNSGGPVFWMIDDNLGSPDAVMDNSGNVVDKINRDSFGNVAYESAPTTVHWAGYAGGHLSAATGLVEDGVRWLDPTTGRWLSQDRSGFGGQDTNLSRYAGNDVTNRIDPSGLFSTGYQAFAQGGTAYSEFSIYSDSGGAINQVTMPMGATSSLNMVFNSMAMSGTGSGPSSWLDNYAHAFNGAFGSGYSNALGNAIYNNTPISTSAWSNATDTQLLTGTAVVSAVAVVGAYFAVPAALSAIASSSLSIPLPYIAPMLAIDAGGALSLTAVAGVTTVTVSGSNIATIAVGTGLAYMAAQGGGGFELWHPELPTAASAEAELAGLESQVSALEAQMQTAELAGDTAQVNGLARLLAQLDQSIASLKSWIIFLTP